MTVNGYLTSDFRKEQQFIKRHWKDVRVGDFVKVVCNEIVPADLLLLHTSDPSGVCHIETSNLDGEINLKQRKMMSGVCISVRSTSWFHFSIVFFFSFYTQALCAASSFSSSLWLTFNTHQQNNCNISWTSMVAVVIKVCQWVCNDRQKTHTCWVTYLNTYFWTTVVFPVYYVIMPLWKYRLSYI